MPAFTVAQTSLEIVRNDVLNVKHTQDFAITGDGSAANWNNTAWLTLPQRNKADVEYQTQVKVLYSDSGIYFHNAYDPAASGQAGEVGRSGQGPLAVQVP